MQGLFSLNFEGIHRGKQAAYELGFAFAWLKPVAIAQRVSQAQELAARRVVLHCVLKAMHNQGADDKLAHDG